MNHETKEACFGRYGATGSADGLGQVFDELAPQLLGLAAHLARDQAAAEDLVQATFLAALEGAKAYDPARPLLPWMTGILVRQAARARRKDGRSPSPSRLWTRRVRTPLDRSQGSELREAIGGALDSLPELYRDVLGAHLLEGQSPSEIASRLQRKPGTVRVQLHRGIDLLRKSLPAGFAFGAAAAVVPSRGMAAMRAEFLRTASVPASRWTLGSLAPWLLGAGALAIVGALALILRSGALTTPAPLNGPRLATPASDLRAPDFELAALDRPRQSQPAPPAPEQSPPAPPQPAQVAPPEQPDPPAATHSLGKLRVTARLQTLPDDLAGVAVLLWATNKSFAVSGFVDGAGWVQVEAQNTEVGPLDELQLRIDHPEHMPGIYRFRLIEGQRANSRDAWTITLPPAAFEPVYARLQPRARRSKDGSIQAAVFRAEGRPEVAVGPPLDEVRLKASDAALRVPGPGHYAVWVANGEEDTYGVVEVTQASQSPTPVSMGRVRPQRQRRGRLEVPAGYPLADAVAILRPILPDPPRHPLTGELLPTSRWHGLIAVGEELVPLEQRVPIDSRGEFRYRGSYHTDLRLGFDGLQAVDPARTPWTEVRAGKQSLRVTAPVLGVRLQAGKLQAPGRFSLRGETFLDECALEPERRGFLFVPAHTALEAYLDVQGTAGAMTHIQPLGAGITYDLRLSPQPMDSAEPAALLPLIRPYPGALHLRWTESGKRQHAVLRAGPEASIPLPKGAAAADELLVTPLETPEGDLARERSRAKQTAAPLSLEPGARLRLDFQLPARASAEFWFVEGERWTKLDGDITAGPWVDGEAVPRAWTCEHGLPSGSGWIFGQSGTWLAWAPAALVAGRATSLDLDFQDIGRELGQIRRRMQDLHSILQFP